MRWNDLKNVQIENPSDKAIRLCLQADKKLWEEYQKKKKTKDKLQSIFAAVFGIIGVIICFALEVSESEELLRKSTFFYVMPVAIFLSVFFGIWARYVKKLLAVRKKNLSYKETDNHLRRLIECVEKEHRILPIMIAEVLFFGGMAIMFFSKNLTVMMIVVCVGMILLLLWTFLILLPRGKQRADLMRLVETYNPYDNSELYKQE